MNDQSELCLARKLTVFSSWGGYFAILIGIVALVGWSLHINALKSWVPGQITMRANTALCLVMLGTALILLKVSPGEKPRSRKPGLARMLATVVLLVGLLSLAEHLFGWDVGIDQALVTVHPGDDVGAVRPGLMSLISSLNFSLLSLSLLLLDWKTRRQEWVSQFLCAGALVASSLGWLDFAPPYHAPYLHMAFPTAVAFTVLSCAIICARSQWALGGLLNGQFTGARWFRRTAPLVLFFWILLGGLVSRSILTPAYLTWAELSGLAIAVGIALIGFMIWVAILLDQADRQRAQAEAATNLRPEQLDRLMERYWESPVEASLRRWSIAGIALGIVLALLAAADSWRSTQEAVRTADWVAQTHLVTSTIETVFSAAVEIETSTRGFAATGNPTFLEAASIAERRIQSDLDKLRTLTKDNQSQQERIDRLQKEIGERVSLSSRVIAQRQHTGKVPPEEVFLEGKRRMDAIRSTIDAMQVEQKGILGQRTVSAVEARQRSGTIILLTSILSLALLSFSGFVIGRSISQTANMRAEVQQLNRTLEQRIEERTAELGRVAAIVEGSDNAIVGTTLDGTITTWNTGAQRLFRYVPQEAIGKHLSILVPPGLRSEFDDNLRRARSDVPRPMCETVRLRKDGRLMDVSVSASSVRDPRGKIVGYSAIYCDITERKRAQEEIRTLNRELENRVRERTAALEAANHELETFTYSVSHDLRAPVRHISGFSKLLAEELGPSLPEDAQHHLQRIVEGCRRMGLLIDDLLNLARVGGRRVLDLRPIDLRSIVQEVIHTLEPDCEHRQVEFKIGNLPSVECDKALMAQLFQNLISNALKFTRPRPITLIEIGQETRDSVPVIFVRDNGVGFSMKYADKLFGVFQRLHRAEDFEGSGVGLATVQRIIQKHRGRIWAEAELDKGATFFFTLGNPESADVNGKAAKAGETT